MDTASGFWGNGSFDYDVLGNITQKTLGNDTLTYHYSNNRLTSVTGALNRSFSYDTRGNVINNGARSFTFNRAGRLASSGSISYLYDGHGRRVMKNHSGSKTYSLYSQQGRLISTIHNGAITDYIYLGGQLVARHSNNQTNDNQPGYTGHLEDDDLQLMYMQARYYDPVIGRFYSNDPVGTLGHLSQGNIQGFNRYAYANNNPYKYVDPDGKLPIVPVLVAGGRACASNAVCRGTVVSGSRATARGARRAYNAIVGVFNESAPATGQDAIDVVTGGKEATHSGKKSGKITDFFPDISSGEADDIMDEVKDLEGVDFDDTENERGPMTVASTRDGTIIVDRVGAGGIRSIETQSGNRKTKTRVRDEQQ
ncbi:RHS repeat-associated core domain-containing protein [Aliidiomarina shirensis]|uniref:RHS repeat-associated core domain-containing protein n=1 Tax=Aliidiomarina shirensis TaxID=1048642 RepID=UPI001F5405E0|nr:RHS repeat-associated core domain-containing protein [Aliidiomarina shirensis]